MCLLKVFVWKRKKRSARLKCVRYDARKARRHFRLTERPKIPLTFLLNIFVVVVVDRKNTAILVEQKLFTFSFPYRLWQFITTENFQRWLYIELGNSSCVFSLVVLYIYFSTLFRTTQWTYTSRTSSWYTKFLVSRKLNFFSLKIQKYTQNFVYFHFCIYM